MKAKEYIFLIVILLNGCSTINQQQRPDSTPCIENDVATSKCSSSSYIHLDIDDDAQNPILSFMEFDIEGNPFDQRSIDQSIERIEKLSADSEKSILLIVFIHG